jgi:hypothetical protein
LLQAAAPRCFDCVVAYAPTPLNMTAGQVVFTPMLIDLMRPVEPR